jgi:lipopolysaccharide transport system ATP-binding protein
LTHSIEIQSLSKRYQIGRLQHRQTLREDIIEFAKRPFGRRNDYKAESMWALRDVSFEVAEGEVVGIIGRNGAGKSTLLKILSKITYPTEGKINVRGRVASLLEVGTGFHEELTGRENIYLNGSILGMKKREVDKRFDAIVAFSGVEQFIDTQIKRYSSGMRMRLGFAVAAHLEPDVLIVDEVLAVGDAGFQKKCLDAMEGLRSGGRTVLFVSHNLSAVENLCSRGIWLDGGKVRMDGGAKEVILAYMASFAGSPTAESTLVNSESRQGSGEIRYTRVEYLNPDRTPRALVRSGDSLVIRLHYHTKKTVLYPMFWFRLFTNMGTLITETAGDLHGVEIPRVESGDGYIEVEIESFNLLPAQYYLSLWITDEPGSHVYDGDARTLLEVEPANIYASGWTPNSRQGIVFFPQRWSVPSVEMSPGPSSDPGLPAAGW